MPPTSLPCTEAAQRALAHMSDLGHAADLLYLEAWECDLVPGPAAARRVAQFRRANPALADAVRRELSRRRA